MHGTLIERESETLACAHDSNGGKLFSCLLLRWTGRWLSRSPRGWPRVYLSERSRESGGENKRMSRSTRQLYTCISRWVCEGTKSPRCHISVKVTHTCSGGEGENEDICTAVCLHWLMNRGKVFLVPFTQAGLSCVLRGLVTWCTLSPFACFFVSAYLMH